MSGYKVPWAQHGSGGIVGSSPTIGGDALPNGGGKWATKASGIWTPGAFRFVQEAVRRNLRDAPPNITRPPGSRPDAASPDA